MQTAPSAYTVNQRPRRKPGKSFSWIRFGWLVFYICLAQWLLILALCFAGQGALVTTYYYPVILGLRSVTPAETLANPTLQNGMIWLGICMLTYSAVLAAVCSLFLKPAPARPRRPGGPTRPGRPKQRARS